MANENRNTTSAEVKNANDDVFCTPCYEEGSENVAICKCIECQSYFCQNCVKLHNKILKLHTLIGKTDNKLESITNKPLTQEHLFTDTCEEHPAEVLKMFCKHHDLVCCTVCAAINHRLCDGMQYIPSIAKGISERKDMTESLESLDKVREELQQLLSERTEDLSRLDGQRDRIISILKEITNRLITRIKKTEGQTSEQIDTRHLKIKSETECDMNSIESVLNSVEKHLNKINETEAEKEVQLFIKIKLGQKAAAKGKEQLDKIMNKKVKSLEYEFKSNIESCLEEFGNFDSGNYAAVATMVRECNVTLETERISKVSVYGVCLFDTNEIILADNSNLKLKRLDTKYRMYDWIDLGATPYGLCRTGHSEVAVSFPWLHKIQFVSVGSRKMVLTWSFKVDEICRGICYSEGNLYICCGGSGSEDPGHVVVYDMTGSLLRTFKTDQYQKNLLMCPENILLADSKVYIADMNRGVTVLNKKGDFLSCIFDPRLACANDVGIGDDGEIFVCGRDSKNVLQFDKCGNVINEVLTQEDNILTPLTVTYLRNPARLLITYEGSGKIKLFELDK